MGKVPEVGALGPFKSNFSLLINEFSVATGAKFAETLSKTLGWMQWVIRRDTGVTEEHFHHLMCEGIPELASSLLNRRKLDEHDVKTAKDALSLCLTFLWDSEHMPVDDLEANEAGLAILRILDPSRPVYNIDEECMAWSELRKWPPVPKPGAAAWAVVPASTGGLPGSMAVDDETLTLDGKVVSVHDVVEVLYLNPLPPQEHGEEGEGGEDMGVKKPGWDQVDDGRGSRGGTWVRAIVTALAMDVAEVSVLPGCTPPQPGEGVTFWLSTNAPGVGGRLAGLGTHTGNANEAPEKATTGRTPPPSPSMECDSPSLTVACSEEERVWRASLGVGVGVDMQDGAGMWTVGRVVDAGPARGDGGTGGSETPALGSAWPWLCVKPLGYPSYCEEWVRRDSQRIAPWAVRSRGRRGVLNGPGTWSETLSERQCSVPGPIWVPGTTVSPPLSSELDDRLVRGSGQGRLFRLRHYSVTQYGRVQSRLYIHVLNEAARLLTKHRTWPLLRDLRASAGTESRLHLAAVAEATGVHGRLADILCGDDVGHDIATVWYKGLMHSWINGVTVDDARDVNRATVEALTVGAGRLLAKLIGQPMPPPGAALSDNFAEYLHTIEEQCVLGLAASALRSDNILRRREGLLLLQDAWTLVYNRVKHPLGIAKVSPSSPSSARPDYRILPVLYTLTIEDIARYVGPPTPGLVHGQGAKITWPGLDLLHDVCVSRHHQELVRQSGHLLRILAHACPPPSPTPPCVAGALTRGMLQDVWAACWRSAEEDTRDGVAMLGETVADLPPSVTTYLLELALAAGGTAWPVHTVRLYEACAVSQRQGGGEGQAENGGGPAVVRRALSALFCLSLGVPPCTALTPPSSDVQGEVSALARRGGCTVRTAVLAGEAEAAQGALLAALAVPQCGAMRATFMRVCVRNIAAHVYASQSLELLRRIVGTFQSKVTPPPPPPPPSSAPALPLFDLPLSASKGKGGDSGKKGKATAVTQLLMQSLNNPGVMASLSAAMTPEAAARFAAASACAAPPSPPSTVTASQAVSSVHAHVDVVRSILSHARALHRAGKARARADGMALWGEGRGEAEGVHMLEVTPGGIGSMDAGTAWEGDGVQLDWALVGVREGGPLGCTHQGGAGGAERVGPGILSCLRTLASLLSASSLTFSQGEAEEVWDEFVAAPLCGTVRRAALALFMHGVVALAESEGPVGGVPGSGGGSEPSPDPTGLMFNAATACHLFSTRLTVQEWEGGAVTGAMDLTAFVTWRAFFLYVNGRAGHVAHGGKGLVEAAGMMDCLDMGSSASTPGKSVTGLGPASVRTLGRGDPPGMDTLWSVALHAADGAVAAAAGHLLTVLQPMGGSDSDTAEEYRRAYIRRTLAYLAACSGSAPHAGPGADDPLADVRGCGGRRGSLPTHWPPPPLLPSRAVSLLLALLDGAEEEVADAESRLGACIEAAVLLSGRGALGGDAGLMSDLEEARRTLLFSTHGGGLASLLDGDGAGVPLDSEPAVMLRVRLVGVPMGGGGGAAKPVPMPVLDERMEGEGFIGPLPPPSHPPPHPTPSHLQGELILCLPSHASVRHVRGRMLAALGLPPSAVRLFIPAVSTIAGRAIELSCAVLGLTLAQLALTPDPLCTVMTMAGGGGGEACAVWRGWMERLADPPTLTTSLRSALHAVSCCPAHLIASSPYAMSLLLRLVDGGGAGEGAGGALWRLLCRLPTPPALLPPTHAPPAWPTRLCPDIALNAPATALYSLIGVRSMVHDMAGGVRAFRHCDMTQHGLGVVTSRTTAAVTTICLDAPGHVLLQCVGVGSPPSQASLALRTRVLARLDAYRASLGGAHPHAPPPRTGHWSADARTWEEAAAWGSSFTSADGPGMLLGLVRLCVVAPSPIPVLTALGAVALDLLQRYVVHSLVHEGGGRIPAALLYQPGPVPTLAPDLALALPPTPPTPLSEALLTTLHATLGEALGRASAVQALPPTRPSPMAVWMTVQCIRLWGCLSLSRPCPSAMGGGMASSLTALLGGRYGEGGEGGLAIACTTAAVLYAIHACDGPLSPAVLDLVLSSRPRPHSPTPLSHAATSVHYALLEVVLGGECERMGRGGRGRSGEGKVVPGSGPSPARPLPPRVRLPQPLRTLLADLAADLASCPPMETVMHAALAARAIEDGHKASVDSPDVVVGEAGWGYGARSAEEGRMARALAGEGEEGGGASPLDSPLPPPSPSPSRSFTLSACPKEWTVALLTAVRTASAHRSASLYALAPMHPCWADMGWEVDPDTVLRQFMASCPGGVSGFGPGSAHVKEYAPVGNGGGAVLWHTDGSVRGMLPSPTLACVLTPRPYDTLCTVPGVDTLLLGLCRSAAVLVEADPVGGAEVGTGGLLEVLLKQCLLGPGAWKPRDGPFASWPPSRQTMAQAGLVHVRLDMDCPALPKAKTLPCRRAVFALLTALVRRSPRNVSTVCTLLSGHTQAVWDGPHPGLSIGHAESRLNPTSYDLRSPSGYAGLKNLGCTCYMNALLQQFYHMQRLRYGVLAVLDAADPAALPFLLDKGGGGGLGGLVARRDSDGSKLIDGGIPSTGEGYEGRAEGARRESFLYQLQRVFAGLELTTGRAWDPREWMTAYKDLDGRPTNPSIQQDAQEFLTTFLDRLEEGLAGTPRAGLVQSTLGCESRGVRACTGGCGTVRTSSDPTLCLSVDVGAGSLGAALAGYTAWEDIPGYECEACGRKTTLRKRSTLGSTADTLILHLKRFSMNYDTGVPLKINSRFSFPMSIDLYPYSFEALASEGQEGAEALPPSPSPTRWQYSLVGVVVHMGSLDSGHYYSYIQERGPRGRVTALQRAAAASPSTPSWTPAQHVPPDMAERVERAGREAGPHGVWFEFNDSAVLPFDASSMEEACFGSGGSGDAPPSSSVVRSAYMLVYERVACTQDWAGGVLTAPKGEGEGGEAEGTDAALAAALSAHAAAGVAGAGVPPSSPASSSKRARLGEGMGPECEGGEGGRVPLPALPAPLARHALRDRTGRGPLPVSHVADIGGEDAALALSWGLVDREMGAFMLCLADTVSRQASHVPLLAACPCPLPPLHTAVPLLDGDEEEQGGGGTHTPPLPADILLRGLLAHGVWTLPRSLYGQERLPAPPLPAYYHALARIVGARGDAAAALLEDLVAGEGANEVAYVAAMQDSLTVKGAGTSLPARIAPSLPSPPLTGRMGTSYSAKRVREGGGWCRPGMFGLHTGPPSRAALGRLILTALLRCGLPCAELVQGGLLYPQVVPHPPSIQRDRVRQEEAYSECKLLHDTALANADPHTQAAVHLVSSTLRLLSQPSLMLECTSTAWMRGDAWWAMWYDMARGGYGCGLPIPLSHVDDPMAGSPPVGDGEGGGALVLAARLQASAEWATGVCRDSALGARPASLAGVTGNPCGKRAPPSPPTPPMSLADAVYRGAALAVWRLRTACSEGRPDVRGTTLTFLGQFDDNAVESDRESGHSTLCRLARWAAPPGYLTRLSSLKNDKAGLHASLTRAYDLVALLARCAPGRAACIVNRAPSPLSLALSPVPRACHAPVGLITLMEEAMRRGGGGVGDVHLPELLDSLRGPPPTSLRTPHACASSDIGAAWAREEAVLRAGSGEEAAKAFIPAHSAQCARLLAAYPAAAGAAWVSVPTSQPLLHPGWAIPSHSRVIGPTPCEADADLLCRAAVRTNVYVMAAAGQKGAGAKAVEIGDWAALNWEVEMSLGEARWKGQPLGNLSLAEHAKRNPGYDFRVTLTDSIRAHPLIEEYAWDPRGISLSLPSGLYGSLLSYRIEEGVRGWPLPEADTVMLDALAVRDEMMGRGGEASPRYEVVHKYEAALVALALGEERRDAVDRGAPYPFGHNMEAIAVLCVAGEAGNFNLKACLPGRKREQAQNSELRLLLHKWLEIDIHDLDEDGERSRNVAAQIAEVSLLSSDTRAVSESTASAVCLALLSSFRAISRERAVCSSATLRPSLDHAMLGVLHTLVRLSCLSWNVARGWLCIDWDPDAFPNLDKETVLEVEKALWTVVEGALKADGWGKGGLDGAASHWDKRGTTPFSLPAYVLHALDPGNEVLGLPPSALPSHAAVLSSYAAVSGSAWKAALLAALSGPVTQLTLREERVAAGAAMEGNGPSACLALCRLHRLLQCTRWRMYEQRRQAGYGDLYGPSPSFAGIPSLARMYGVGPWPEREDVVRVSDDEEEEELEEEEQQEEEEGEEEEDYEEEDGRGDEEVGEAEDEEATQPVQTPPPPAPVTLATKASPRKRK